MCESYSSGRLRERRTLTAGKKRTSLAETRLIPAWLQSEQGHLAELQSFFQNKQQTACGTSRRTHVQAFWS